MTLAEHIEELRAEARGALTRRERNATQAELARAIAALAEIERAAPRATRTRGGDPPVLSFAIQADRCIIHQCHSSGDQT